MHPYTAIFKRRACTVKAETKVKVDAINERMAANCDRALSKQAAKEERQNRRLEARKQKRGEV